MRHSLNLIIAVTLAGTLIVGTDTWGQRPTTGRDDTRPLSIKAAKESIHLRPEFDLELVASEPLVKDPVAIDWDTQGRLWVVEMADYPLGIDGQGKPGGRVRILTDKNEDGIYDASTVFLAGISFPNGIITWRNGAIITAAPDIIFAEDLDGDGKMDRQQVLYSGFQQGNQQLRMNGLRWGLDNWIHCASGSHHSGYGKDTSITVHATQKNYPIGNRDFRIRPDSHQMMLRADRPNTAAIEMIGGIGSVSRTVFRYGTTYSQIMTFAAIHILRHPIHERI